MASDTLDLRPTPDGVILPVQAQAGARRNGIVGLHGGRLKVAVTQVAEKGKANAALVRVIAEELGLKPSQVVLASGKSAARKEFLVSGVAVEALQAAIVGRLERGSVA